MTRSFSGGGAPGEHCAAIAGRSPIARRAGAAARQANGPADGEDAGMRRTPP